MDINSFLPPLVGSFCGVGAGIIANYKIQSCKNANDKKKYKTMIRSEIELCINILEQDNVHFLPIDRWTSAINSGALKLFEVDIELEPLSIAYQRIKDYNQLITAGQFNGAVWEGILRGVESPKFSIHIEFSVLVASRISLLKELRELVNAEWWNGPAVSFGNDPWSISIQSKK